MEHLSSTKTKGLEGGMLTKFSARRLRGKKQESFEEIEDEQRYQEVSRCDVGGGALSEGMGKV